MNATTRPRVVIVPRYGLGALGQDSSITETPPTFMDPTLFPELSTSPSISGGGFNLPTTATVTSTGTPPGPTFSWTSFLNNLVQQAGATARADIAPLSVLPRGSTYFQSPYGTAVTTGGAVNPFASQLTMQSLTSSLTGMLPILLIVGGVILVISMAGKK